MKYSVYFPLPEPKITSNASLRRENRVLIMLFLLYMVILIPFCRFLSAFFNTVSKPYIWRLAATYSLRALFGLGGLKISIRGDLPNKRKTIYIANHLSRLDGFFVIAVLGPKIIPVIAPFAYFGFPFSYWFRRMGCIDVQRSELESAKYQESNSSFAAVTRVVSEIKEGHSVLIFPEGHIEYEKRLLYFHTGAARIALAADAKIIPLGLANVENIVYGKYFFNSGTIRLSAGKEIDVVKYYKEKSANIQQTAAMLKDSLGKLLPERYLPIDRAERNPEKTAAIFCINRVIYQGNAALDFIRLFWKKGYFKTHELAILSFYFMLRKNGLISEKKLINYGARLLKDREPDRIYRDAKEIFERHMKLKISEKIRTLIIDHQKKGHKIIISTRMLAPLAKIFADHLHADYWQAACLEEKNLSYTGNLDVKNRFSDKGEQIKDLSKLIGISLEQSFAYGHDANDLVLLANVKYRRLVNPRRSILTKMPNSLKYEIIRD